MIEMFLQAILLAADASLLLLAAYLLLLTLAALVARFRSSIAESNTSSDRTFAILVPAHNEEAVLGRLLASLDQLDYPRTRFDVHVVADNCTDRTAEVAEVYNVIVHRRLDATRRAKGFALSWLLDRLSQSRRAYDAYVVIDADSVVSANFLRSMDAHLAQGSMVVQAYYSVLNTGASAVATLRFAALAALHYLRPLGRSVLGLSCGLKGNGMCFAAPVLEQFGWRWFTLAEDAEFHLALVRSGLRVDFAPEAVVLAEMPVTLGQAASQNARWERGRLQLLRTEAPKLVREGLRSRKLPALDAVAEQLMPPISVPFALGAVSLLVSLVQRQQPAATLAGLALVALAVHLAVGLALVQAPFRVYRGLAFAPIYIIWKVGVYGRALVSSGARPWVRTTRISAAAAIGDG